MKEISPEEFDKPLSKGGKTLEPLELLPDREWLAAHIDTVDFQYSQFNGKIQMMKDPEGNDILDDDGQPIPRREFKITFTMNDYELPNGKPRKCWLNVGASLGEKAHLPTLLESLNVQITEMTPNAVINGLQGLKVKLQLANKKSKDGTKTYQKVLYDAVKPRLDGEPKPIHTDPEDIEWT